MINRVEAAQKIVTLYEAVPDDAAKYDAAKYDAAHNDAAQDDAAKYDAAQDESSDAEKSAILNNRAISAKQSETEASILIDEFMPFLNARVSRYTASFSGHMRDDALSVSMIALHEAIQKYDIDKGHFFPFADRVVRARIIDHIRKVSRQERNQVSLDAEDEFGQSTQASAVNIISIRNYDEEQRRLRIAEEIEQFTADIASWGITMEALTKSSPKHKELRKTYKEIVSKIANCTDIMQTINIKRYFPIKAISKITGLPQKKLERSRTYVIALLIIRAGDYELLSDFIE